MLVVQPASTWCPYPETESTLGGFLFE